MTNRLAIILGLILIGGAAADLLLTGGDVLLFLARRLFVLLDYLMFWH